MAVEQHGCEAALQQGTSPVDRSSPLCSALFCLCPGLVWYALLYTIPVYSTLLSGPARCLWCFGSSQGDAVSSLRWKQKVCSLSQRWDDLHGKKSPFQVPDWFIFIHMKILNSCSSIGPKGTALIDQWRYWWGYSCMALIPQGKTQSCRWKYNSGTPL